MTLKWGDGGDYIILTDEDLQAIANLLDQKLEEKLDQKLEEN